MIRSVHPRLLTTLALFALLVSAGCSSDEASSEQSADEATQERLEEAYATLEAAGKDVPNARLPRLDGKGKVEVVEPGENYQASSPKHLGLLDYFGEREIAFGLALIENESERGAALSAIEFTNATDSIELIIPKQLRHGSARELLSGDVTFAAISPSGEIYCIDDAEIGVESCPAPELPEQ